MEVAVTTARSAADGPQAEVYPAARQDKPWGHELIFAAIGGKYVGKIIHVNAGRSPRVLVFPVIAVPNPR
jgi:hypothetical protein